MKPENTISQFFESVPVISGNEGMMDSQTARHLESLAATAEMTDESVYIVDPGGRCFRYVSGRGLFLYGHSCGEVLRLGYNFYSELVHPDDPPLSLPP